MERKDVKQYVKRRMKINAAASVGRVSPRAGYLQIGEGERKVYFHRGRKHVDGKLPGRDAGELEVFEPQCTESYCMPVL